MGKVPISSFETGKFLLVAAAPQVQHYDHEFQVTLWKNLKKIIRIFIFLHTISNCVWKNKKYKTWNKFYSFIFFFHVLLTF